MFLVHHGSCSNMPSNEFSLILHLCVSPKRLSFLFVHSLQWIVSFGSYGSILRSCRMQMLFHLQLATTGIIIYNI